MKGASQTLYTLLLGYSLHGHGYGYGYGYDHGHGYGHDYGHGNGQGHGHNHGHGHGYRHGHGHGYRNGYGYGQGHGHLLDSFAVHGQWAHNPQILHLFYLLWSNYCILKHICIYIFYTWPYK